MRLAQLVEWRGVVVVRRCDVSGEDEERRWSCAEVIECGLHC